MPLTSIAAVAFPKLGSTRASASAKGIPYGANSPCTGEVVTWPPWELITKAHQGKTHLIHMWARRAICKSPGLTGRCSQAHLCCYGERLGVSGEFRQYFQAPGSCNLPVGEVPLHHSQGAGLSLVASARASIGMGILPRRAVHHQADGKWLRLLTLPQILLVCAVSYRTRKEHGVWRIHCFYGNRSKPALCLKDVTPSSSLEVAHYKHSLEK